MDGKVISLIRSKLTAKQEAFAQLVGKGLTKSEAYRSVYDVKTSKPEHIHCEASKLASHPNVSQRIREIETAIADSMIKDSVAIRRHVITGLFAESKNHSDGNPSSRLKALELLGRLDIVDCFTRKSETAEQQRSADDVEAELRKLLRSVMK